MVLTSYLFLFGVTILAFNIPSVVEGACGAQFGCTLSSTSYTCTMAASACGTTDYTCLNSVPTDFPTAGFITVDLKNCPNVVIASNTFSGLTFVSPVVFRVNTANGGTFNSQAFTGSSFYRLSINLFTPIINCAPVVTKPNAFQGVTATNILSVYASEVQENTLQGSITTGATVIVSGSPWDSVSGACMFTVRTGAFNGLSSASFIMRSHQAINGITSTQGNPYTIEAGALSNIITTGSVTVTLKPPSGTGATGSAMYPLGTNVKVGGALTFMVFGNTAITSSSFMQFTTNPTSTTIQLNGNSPIPTNFFSGYVLRTLTIEMPDIVDIDYFNFRWDAFNGITINTGGTSTITLKLANTNGLIQGFLPNSSPWTKISSFTLTSPAGTKYPSNCISPAVAYSQTAPKTINYCAFMTQSPTQSPVLPTNNPTKNPTKNPTRNPTKSPTKSPTKNPTKNPTNNPTKPPSNTPTKSPTQPTLQPTLSPVLPTKSPTKNPTQKPTTTPTIRPSLSPILSSTRKPTTNPTQKPTSNPSPKATRLPTNLPTKRPSINPTINQFTKSPTKLPTKRPTTNPTPGSTRSPTKLPTKRPNYIG